MKKSIGLILCLLVGAELFVYLTRFQVTFPGYLFQFNVLLLLAVIIYIAYIIKPVWLKLLLTFFTFLTGSVMLGLFYFTTGFGCKEEVENFWEINTFEITRSRNVCWNGVPGRPVYTLHKKYIFGLLKYPLEEQDAHPAQEPECLLEFKTSGHTFNICEGKIIK